MGLARRNKSGRDFAGSKLNVPGQGIFSVVRSPNDKSKIRGKGVQISGVKQETPTISPKPIPSSTPQVSPTPTPTPTPLPQNNKIFQTGDNFLLMGGDIYIFENQ